LKATDESGVNISVDFVGGPYFQGNLDVVARDGHIVTLGALGGTKLPAGVDIGAFVRKRIRFEGSSLRSRDPDYQGKLRDCGTSWKAFFRNSKMELSRSSLRRSFDGRK
jgi:NADPH:quinone reductase-like Zn-dependent oxidoreductase